MHETFRNALNPVPRYRCMGKTLQPFTLGHAFLLADLESPTVEPGQPIELGDLLLAVWVCSQDRRNAARKMLGRMWGAQLWAWWRGLWSKRSIFHVELSAFLHYLHSSRAMPPVRASQGVGTRTLGAPDEWRLYDLLTGRGLTHEQALDTPYCVAQCLWAVRGELDGKFELATASGSVSAIISHLHRKAKKQ